MFKRRETFDTFPGKHMIDEEIEQAKLVVKASMKQQPTARELTLYDELLGEYEPELPVEYVDDAE